MGSPGFMGTKVEPNRIGLGLRENFRASLSRRRLSALVFGIDISEEMLLSIVIPSGRLLKDRERFNMRTHFGQCYPADPHLQSVWRYHRNDHHNRKWDRYFDPWPE